MSGHLTDCTTLLEYDEQTEYHDGCERCPACDEEQAAISEAERYADFGMGWVTSGGDPADARLAWSQDKALIAEREEEERLQRIEDEVAGEAERKAVTRPKKRLVKGWRKEHCQTGTDQPFKGYWTPEVYEPGCVCAKCENWFHEMADCAGAYEFYG